jgi:hypothetical protein
MTMPSRVVLVVAAGLVIVAATAVLLLRSTGSSPSVQVDASAAPAGLTHRAFYVNMRDDGPYRIGRYVDARPSPPRAVAGHACGTWSPSVVDAGQQLYLYAAEDDCKGWHLIVRYTSHDDGVQFGERVVIGRYPSQIRMPLVVRDDRGMFHLWYTQDRGATIGWFLRYATSRDGIHFGPPATKLTAGRLTTISVSTAFRLGDRWQMVIEGYNRDLTTADPELVTFASPEQRRYRLEGLIRVQRSTPKLDMSFVCRHGRSWRGLFTLYGATKGPRAAWEWTEAFEASRLRGPWRRIPNSSSPVLGFRNDGTTMHSVENPAEPQRSPDVPRC